MEFTYKLDANDFLQYQLFTASKSKKIAKKKMYGWLLFTLAAAIFALYCFFNDSTSLAIYFSVIAGGWGLLYPKYFNWKYVKHYTDFINKNYKNRFDKTTKISFSKEYIIATDDSGEGKIKVSEVVSVNETSPHIFITFLSGASLIIPKRELHNNEELKNSLVKIGLTINNELNWIWKLKI
jgi:hypothetical protein